MVKKTSRKRDENRGRAWCFTVQGWDDEYAAHVSSMYEDDLNATYLIIGWERGDRTLKEHLQCFIYYTNPVTQNYLMSKVPNKAHIEITKGTLTAAYVYCMEEHDCYEVGKRPRQGHRTDLEVIKYDMLDRKKTMYEISTEYFSQWCQYRRSFDEFQRMHDLLPKYDTLIYLYDNESVESVKLVYDMKTSKSFLMPWIDASLSTVYDLYFLKKYDKIFINYAVWCDRINLPVERLGLEEDL